MHHSYARRAGLALALALFAAPWAAAQTTFVVCVTGPPACLYSSIQAAVDAASDGDEVLVLPGTYTENVTVLDKDIEIRSDEGRDNTTIQGVSGAGALGTLLLDGTTGGFVLEGFTVVGIDNGNPAVENAAVYVRGSHTNLSVLDSDIRADGDLGFLAEFGATLSSPTLSGNVFSGKTFVGPNPAGLGSSQQFTLPNVPRQLVSLGNGGGVSGALVTGLTFTNNQVTGTTGGLNTDGFEQGNQGATLDAANATITGNTFAITTRSFFATQLRVRRPGATISGNTFSDDGLSNTPNHLFTQNNATSLDAIAAANTFERGVYVDGGTTIAVSIQPTVAAVPTGTTVDVLSGTYVEQVVVNAKAITLLGAGAATTRIQAPDAPAPLAACFNLGGGDIHPVVCARNNANLTLDGFTVDGNGRGNGYDLMGVALYQSGGAIRNNTVEAVRSTPADGVQSGLAIWADNYDAGTYSVVIEDNLVQDFQKNGITVGGIGMTASVTGNTVVGYGPVGFIAQNGVQFAFGATGSVEGNTISDISYDPTPDNEPNDFFDAAGVIVYLGDDVLVEGNTITDVEAGVLASDSRATVSTNAVSASAAGTGDDDYLGVYVDSYGGAPGGSLLKGSDAPTGRRGQPALVARLAEAALDGGAGASMAGTVPYEVNGNDISGGDDGSGTGLYAYAYALDGTQLSLAAADNQVNDFATGVYICEDEEGLVQDVDLDGNNDLSDNDVALNTCIANDIDAENNFWGVFTQEAIAALIVNTGDGTVDFVPFQATYDLTATNTSPLTVEPGGQISFNYTITNTTNSPVTGDLYFIAERNGNQVASGVIRSGTLPGGVTVSGSFTQNVPGLAPEGEYTYFLRIGQFPNFTADEEVFLATVDDGEALAGSDAARGEAPASEAWTVVAAPWEVIDTAAPAVVAEAPAASALVGVPTMFGVEVAPNPVAGSARLTLAVPAAAQVRVTVYDVTGREVAVVADGTLDAGTHALALDASTLAPGLYVVRAQSGNEVAVRRIVVAR